MHNRRHSAAFSAVQDRWDVGVGLGERCRQKAGMLSAQGFAALAPVLAPVRLAVCGALWLRLMQLVASGHYSAAAGS